jgi:putative chitinase
MVPTLAQLDLIAGVKVDRSNANSVISALREYGPRYGLDKPHRLAHFLAQVMHESGRFRFDREVWGPTAAQKRYDTRTDLGNTPAVDGDGRKNAGRGPIQVTGAANIAEFEAWCLGQGMEPPDFSGNPDLINTDPWEGLSAIWYWSTRKLNAYADANNIEQITKRINGGLNGFSDRVSLYVRAALVLLGYTPEAVKAFQLTNGLEPDGDAGPLTRAAMHKALSALSPNVVTTAAPVMQEVAVAPEGSEKRAGLWTAALSGIGSVIASVWSAVADMPLGVKIVLGVITLLAIGFMLFRGELIVRRVKSIVAEIGR